MGENKSFDPHSSGETGNLEHKAQWEPSNVVLTVAVVRIVVRY